MIGKGPNVSPAIAAAIISLALGGAAGYYTRYFMETGSSVSASESAGGPGGGMMMPGAAPAAMGGPGGMPPGMGGPGGGPGGGGGGGFNSPGASLARLVRNLNTIESAQGNGLTPDQEKALAPVLAKLKSAETLPEAEATKQTEAIEKVLTDGQKKALEALAPPRGGGGGGGGGGFGGGGGQPDPEKPFASERNKTALESLIKNVGG